MDVPIQSVHIDIKKDGTHDPTLRCAAIRGVIGPDFTVSCLEECLNESYKALIIDAFLQDG